MELLSPFTFPAILFVLTLAFGFWLSSTGKPYNGSLFNLHKLIALSAVVLTGIQLVREMKSSYPNLLTTLILVASGIGLVGLFASGALMSAGKLNQAALLTIHRVGPVVTLLSLTLVIYLIGQIP